MGQINVTASRVESPSATSSKPVTVIDRKTIADSHAENLVDLLKGQPNIVVRDTTGVGAKAQVDLGGFGESASANNVVLVDGRRVNSPDLSGTDWTQIPLDQIERIEIVHGASSVLYGDGAVGGVINIITRIPESGGNISLAGGSFGEFSGHGRLGSDSGKVRVETNISALTTNGYRDDNFFDRFDGGARVEADLPANISLHVSGNHHRDRVGLPGSLTTAQVLTNRKQTTSPQDFSRTSDSFVDGGLNWDSGFGLEADIDGGFRRRNVHSAFVSFGSVSDFVRLNKTLRPKLSYTIGDAVQLHLLGGADLDRDDGSFAFGGAFPLPTTIFDRKRDGYYGTVEVGDAARRWSIRGGGRTERVKDQFRQTGLKIISNRKNAWEAGGTLEILEGLRLRLDASRSIRFPLLDERFNFFTGTVATTLLPQTGRHYSTGLRYVVKDAWVSVDFSRADLTHEVFFNPDTFANANYTSETRHDVVMVSGHWRAHDLLQLGANYTYTRTLFRGGVFDGKAIPAVPRNRFGADWGADWLQGLSTNLHMTYVGRSILISDQANTRTQLPGYFVMDAVVNYHCQGMEMFARVDNLGSRNYSNYGVFSSFSGTDNFFPAPTATFRAGASYKF
ncbi:MAG: TonB-dependent receptor plug domain-containing protein [Mariprofundaceae bacterium]|nr:TonB-dependent receptor plug domain-containing protein [Mariprofundaceae bacterium]